MPARAGHQMRLPRLRGAALASELMAPIRGTLWEGVALRRTRAAADPDSPLRAVALPAAWDGEAAPPRRSPRSPPARARFPCRAPPRRGSRASRPAARRRARWTATAPPSSPKRCARCCCSAAAAPAPKLGAASGKRNGTALRAEPAGLPGGDGGFDAAGYAGACAVGVRALDCLCGGRARRLRLGFADLAGLLAGLGLPYESPEARAVAAAVAALTRGAAEAELGRIAERLGALEPVALAWPAPPAETPVPGLAEAARAALDSAAAAPGLRHAALVALAPPDAAEALLGAGTGGIAPAANASDQPVPDAARQAMREAVAPFLHAPLPLPAAPPGEARPAPRQARVVLRPPADRRGAARLGRRPQGGAPHRRGRRRAGWSRSPSPCPRKAPPIAA